MSESVQVKEYKKPPFRLLLIITQRLGHWERTNKQNEKKNNMTKQRHRSGMNISGRPDDDVKLKFQVKSLGSYEDRAPGTYCRY